MSNHEIAVFGLGRMGGQIARILHRKGFAVYGWNRPEEHSLAENFRNVGGYASTDIAEAIAQFKNTPRIFWIMLPAEAMEHFLASTLNQFLKEGDIIIDGGNSHYKVSIDRAVEYERRGVHYFDCGVAGGILGEQTGFALLVGGQEAHWPLIEPVIQALSSSENDRLIGPSGAGHFAKMVHNGIEYGMMESIAEGFAVLKASPFSLDLARVAAIYQKESIICGTLMDMCRQIFEKEDPDNIAGIIDTTGEGKWTIEAAREFGLDVSVIEKSYDIRQESFDAKHHSKYSNKIVALMRKYFGGHNVHPK